MTKPRTIWTHAEDLIIRRDFRRSTDTELLEKIPGKTLRQIKSHAHFLGVKRGLGVGMGQYYRHKTIKFEPQNVNAEKDAKHVSDCRAQGGFPTAKNINGDTVWIWPSERRAA